MRESRPPWYRTARMIGGVPWVPLEVARGLQERLDIHRQRVQRAETESEEARRVLQRLEAQLADARDRAADANVDAEAARASAARAAEAAEALVDQAPSAPPDTDSRIQRLREDLARIRDRTEVDIRAARQAERVQALVRTAALHDDLHRGLEALPDDPNSPWHQGYRAILQQIDAQLAQAGATPYGHPGDPFDPERHEAVGTAPAPRGEENLLLQVLQPGFAFEDGTLLRPAVVVVGV